MTKVVIPRLLLDRMLSHCRSVYPHEACGILAGKGEEVEKIYEMTNTDRSHISYLMDPGEQYARFATVARTVPPSGRSKDCS